MLVSVALPLQGADGEMIEPELGLAMSVRSHKGGFGLLLGSGVSTAAGIPTGYAVQQDLIRQLAHLKGAGLPADLEAWYRSTFSEDPQYSRLLELLAPSPVARGQLLRNYFEATPEEREQNLKVPTVAHAAIADLVAAGYIRVIITTNFDRLLEQALDAAGVAPVVVSTPEAASGAMPLVHTQCFVLKVNGDYLDTLTMNTVAELTRYDRRIQRLLRRIVDEYGLIVCGWSAEWDIALRRSLLASRARRFTTYWTCRSTLSAQASDIVAQRNAVVLQIQDANTFFVKLRDDVVALERLARPHPLSVATAVETAKRYLAEDRYRIRLHDLVMGEVERLYSNLASIDAELRAQQLNRETYEDGIRKYAAAAEILGTLFATAGYWQRSADADVWMRALQRIADPPGESAGVVAWAELRFLPALLLGYAAGIAAVGRGTYELVRAVLVDVRVTRRNTTESFVTVVDKRHVLEFVTQHSRRPDGPSYSIYACIRPWLREYIPDHGDFDRAFDRFEYLLSLIYEDVSAREGSGPWGRFALKWPEGEHVALLFDQEMTRDQERWKPLAAGLFGGAIERAREVKQGFDRHWREEKPWLVWL